ncbi:ParB N-terminal domain-containing protein [Microbulbifer donghaiensis]|uniref:ParB N-terminal domain-containing protein n=1 Tax=Microbulbifer donghaiensis TaxID=494016 RepID=UPI00093221D6|nr:ParB N-terminal domain-containing protein [Microbulbifer donghaiensis]
MRSTIRNQSSNVYWLRPKELVDLGVQVNKMNRNNCYQFCPTRNTLSKEERQKKYDQLLESIKKHGFSESNPILLMLNRTSDGQDKIRDGHHRLSIALDIDAPLVPVRFVY